MSKLLLRSVMTIGIVALATALVAPARAGDEAKDSTKKLHFTGEITAMDAAAKTITLKSKKDKEMTLTCSDHCKVSTADKEVAAASDLKVGDKITCSYTKEGDKNVCYKMRPASSKKEKEDKGEKAK